MSADAGHTPDPTLGNLPANVDERTVLLNPEQPSFAWLLDLSPLRRGRLYPLKTDGSSLGRSAENDITIEDEEISRFHARLYAESGAERPRFFIQDLASANGTYINDARVAQRALADDDRLVVGDTILIFKQL